MVKYHSILALMSQEQEIPMPLTQPKKSRKKPVGVVIVVFIVIIAIGIVASSGSHNSTPKNINGSSLVKMPGASPSMDEQRIISFNGDYTALSFNLTAVPYQNSEGYGSSYLLNGYSESGYWYQVGISYHWPSSINNTSYRTYGFSGSYEAFAPNGSSVFPSNGGAGTLNVKVNPNDPINLYLAFLNNSSVEFLITDFKTNSSAVEYYSSFGATYFATAGALDTSEGFFTGLMTETYYSSAYYGNQSAVTYSPYGGSISQVWIGTDEYNTSGSNHAPLFFNSTPLINLAQYQNGYDYSYEGVIIEATSSSFTTS